MKAMKLRRIVRAVTDGDIGRCSVNSCREAYTATTNPTSRHFITFSCYHRKPKLSDNGLYDLFPVRLEAMRRQFQMRIYGYVVMPEHVHLLVSEPEHGTLADAMHYLKLSFNKQGEESDEGPG